MTIAIKGVVMAPSISIVRKTASEGGNARSGATSPSRLKRMPRKMATITGVFANPTTVSRTDMRPLASPLIQGTRMKKTNSTWPRSTTAKLKMFSGP